MTSALMLEQTRLLQAVSGQGTKTFNPRGLQVYQANRAVLAERTLASTYPVIAQLLGAENFEPMARHFWQQYPPQRGDMGQWGALLPEFLAAAPQLADEPFLADVAKLEWALHRAASAPDAALDVASFALLASESEVPVTLVLSPGVYTLASNYPVVSLVNAHLINVPTLDEAAALLHEGAAELALVWRQGFKPKVRTVSLGEFSVIQSLEQHIALNTALDKAAQLDTSFDFQAWLGQAAQSGLMIGATRLQT